MPSASRNRRPGPAVLAVALGLLVLSPALGVPHDQAAGAVATGATGAAGAATSGPATGAEEDERGRTWTKHSSDGLAGRIAAPRRPNARGETPFFEDQEVTRSWRYRVAPGVSFRRWSWRDARGPVRAQLLRVDLDAPRLALDYLARTRVPRRARLRALVVKRGAIAGVNGDFFDIDDTGAPLGNGRGRRLGMRSGEPSNGWTKSFWINPRGVPRIGRPHLEAHLSGRRRLDIDQWNAPTVYPGRVGAYLPSWGRTSGRHVVDGQRRRVREVVVRRGRVRRTSTTLRPGQRIRSGFVLVGRGTGARRLRALRPGDRVRLTRRLSRPSRVMISGSVILRENGRDNTVDDREMHPRTAIGIDRDRNDVLLLVVDGRSRRSRGLTMMETSELMRRQGAESALNLDGGGSSTMVARGPGGGLGVMNRPSDGHQRAVPNGIAVVRR